MIGPPSLYEKNNSILLEKRGGDLSFFYTSFFFSSGQWDFFFSEAPFSISSFLDAEQEPGRAESLRLIGLVLSFFLWHWSLFGQCEEREWRISICLPTPVNEERKIDEDDRIHRSTWWWGRRRLANLEHQSPAGKMSELQFLFLSINNFCRSI